jgi:cell division protease FtsH
MALLAATGAVPAALADDFAPPAEAPTSALAQFQQKAQSAFEGDALTAPATTAAADGLPEGNTWRYSEFIRAVMGGKVERVRFSKDGSALQLTAVDGRRASVTLPNDPELVDILAKNGVDISVSEGDQQGNYAVAVRQPPVPPARLRRPVLPLPPRAGRRRRRRRLRRDGRRRPHGLR